MSGSDAAAGAHGGPALDYRAAGVDLDAAAESKERLRRLVESTRTAGAIGAFGGFGGMFRARDEERRGSTPWGTIS